MFDFDEVASVPQVILQSVIHELVDLEAFVVSFWCGCVWEILSLLVQPIHGCQVLNWRFIMKIIIIDLNEDGKSFPQSQGSQLEFTSP